MEASEAAPHSKPCDSPSACRGPLHKHCNSGSSSSSTDGADEGAGARVDADFSSAGVAAVLASYDAEHAHITEPIRISFSAGHASHGGRSRRQHGPTPPLSVPSGPSSPGIRTGDARPTVARAAISDNSDGSSEDELLATEVDAFGRQT